MFGHKTQRCCCCSHSHNDVPQAFRDSHQAAHVRTIFRSAFSNRQNCTCARISTTKTTRRTHGTGFRTAEPLETCCWVPILILTSTPPPPTPEPQRKVSMAAVRGSVRPSMPLETLLLLLLCSHSHYDAPPPEPQRNVSMAPVRGAVRPSLPLETLLLCSYSHIDAPPPRNSAERIVSMAAVRGAVRPSMPLETLLCAHSHNDAPTPTPNLSGTYPWPQFSTPCVRPCHLKRCCCCVLILITTPPHPPPPRTSAERIHGRSTGGRAAVHTTRNMFVSSVSNYSLS